jgi:hypothetical protein
MAFFHPRRIYTLIFNNKLGLCLTATSPITGIVAVVTFKAGGCGKVDGVTITAGCPLMVDTATFTTAAWMCQVECGRAPSSGSVALVAGQPREQASVE